MGKDTFVFYLDWIDHLSMLEPAAAMDVLKAIQRYLTDEEAVELVGAAAIAFSFIKAQLDRDHTKWENTRTKRAEAGKRGAQVTNARQKPANPANADFAEQEAASVNLAGEEAANPAVSVSVPVPVSVSVPSKEGGGSRGADKPPRTRFVPPTLEEVEEYVQKRGSPVDPQSFIDFYASKGWMVGRTPMKDWKAACRNAESWDRWRRDDSQTTGRRRYRIERDESGEETVVFE